jgi:hypothetical protein
LPADFNITFYPNPDYHSDQMDHTIETQTEGKKEQQVEQLTAASRRKLPTPLRRTLRTVSALAAVIGLFFVLYGFIATPQTGVHTSSAPAFDSAKSSTGTQYQQSPEAAAHSTNEDTTLGPVSTSAVHATNTPEPQPTPTQKSSVGTNSTARGPTPLSLDFNQPEVRVLVGILLAILGSIGFILFARRQKQRTRPVKKHSA